MKTISGKAGPEINKIIGLSAVFCILFVSGMLIFSKNVYANGFSCNDFFNRLVVTSFATDYVTDDSEKDDYSLTILKDGMIVGVINGSDITKKRSALPIGRIHDEIASGEVFPDLSSDKDHSIIKNLNYDEDLIDKCIRQLEFVSVLPDHPQLVVRIAMNGDGIYELEDNHDSLKDKDKLIASIRQAIEEGDDLLDLSEVDYDIDLPYSEDQLETIVFFDEIKKWQDVKILLEDMGSSMTLEGKDIADLIVSNDGSTPLMGTDKKPILSEAKLDDICIGIRDDFTSFDSTFWWKKHNGGTVSFNHVKYGVEVDKEKTFELLKDAITSGKDYSGTPVYTEESKHNRLGDTYVEVDMTAQKMYFFQNGKLKMESDVVTGNHARHNDTPQTIEPIYFMQKNRVLVGENYRTPVKFWMAFHNHVGLHDANWRSKFGGDIYKTDGSHGCVNLPTKTAEELYGYVRVGTPVITYY
ncbi:MAG: L,D-transpeptidase [Lachnospiraceae bacterium]|nr:L,D-transpeptidase [Lachnospiraceae bacterium]